MIDRNTTIPLILGALASTLAIAFVTHGIAVSEFTWAVPTRSINPEDMPAITAYFRRLHQFWWLLPSVAAVLALPLVIRRSCQAKYVAWFLSAVAVVCVFWGLFFGLAIYLVRTNFICGK